MNKFTRLRELHDVYAKEPITSDICKLIECEFDISLGAKYLDRKLSNPIMIAPGQMSLNLTQLRTAKRIGYSGVILKSLVGELPDGSCSMISQRKKATRIDTFFETYDAEKEYPIIHWDGRCDVRSITDYLPFAKEAKDEDSPGEFSLIASFLCHLPFPGEEIIKEEWIHTTKVLYDIGYRHMEIDFCPFLAGDDYTEDKKNVISWYRECPSLMKSVAPDILVFPKILNLDWGLEYQLEMAEAAVEGGSDGIVIANRIYKHEYGSGHGGEELRQRNLAQVREIRKRYPKLPVSATGGIYRGSHVLDYLNAGAENVQLLSLLMGRVEKPFAKEEGSRMEKVFHKLLLDPEHGLVASMLKEGR